MANGANAVHMQLRQALENPSISGSPPFCFLRCRESWTKKEFYIRNLILNPRLPIRVKKMEYKIPKYCLTG